MSEKVMLAIITMCMFVIAACMLGWTVFGIRVLTLWAEAAQQATWSQKWEEGLSEDGSTWINPDWPVP